MCRCFQGEIKSRRPKSEPGSYPLYVFCDHAQCSDWCGYVECLECKFFMKENTFKKQMYFAVL